MMITMTRVITYVIVCMILRSIRNHNVKNIASFVHLKLPLKKKRLITVIEKLMGSSFLNCLALGRNRFNVKNKHFLW